MTVYKYLINSVLGIFILRLNHYTSNFVSNNTFGKIGTPKHGYPYSKRFTGILIFSDFRDVTVN
jgi:hypothetical protein